MKIADVLYPHFTALDLIGPYEIISRWPDADVHFLARSRDSVRCDRGLTVIPTDTPATLPDPDLIVVPGSEHPLSLLKDEELIRWVRAAAPGCRGTASVCSGAGLYDPQAPFDSGSPDKADAGRMRLARRVLLGDRAVQKMAAMGLQLVGARIGRARPFKPKHRSTR